MSDFRDWPEPRLLVERLSETEVRIREPLAGTLVGVLRLIVGPGWVFDPVGRGGIESDTLAAIVDLMNDLNRRIK